MNTKQFCDARDSIRKQCDLMSKQQMIDLIHLLDNDMVDKVKSCPICGLPKCVDDKACANEADLLTEQQYGPSDNDKPPSPDLDGNPFDDHPAESDRAALAIQREKQK